MARLPITDDRTCFSSAIIAVAGFDQISGMGSPGLMTLVSQFTLPFSKGHTDDTQYDQDHPIENGRDDREGAFPWSLGVLDRDVGADHAPKQADASADDRANPVAIPPYRRVPEQGEADHTQPDIGPRRTTAASKTAIRAASLRPSRKRRPAWRRPASPQAIRWRPGATRRYL